MKKQIFTFIIGVLVGAIIATAIFLVLKNNSDEENSNTTTENFDRGSFNKGDFDGEMPEDFDGEMPEDFEGGDMKKDFNKNGSDDNNDTTDNSSDET